MYAKKTAGRFIAALAMAIACFGWTSSAMAEEYCVDVVNGSGSTCTCEPLAPCTAIQTALDLTEEASTIKVAGGTYNNSSGTDPVVAGASGVIITGSWNSSFNAQSYPNNPTIIDGLSDADTYSLNVITIGTYAEATLEKVIIRNGNNVSGNGGGLSIGSSSVVTIRNCTFDHNFSNGYGGAIYAQYLTLSITIEDCVFTNNTSNSYGGAISAAYGTWTVKRCFFIDNAAEYGGAIASGIGSVDAVFSRCLFARNFAQSNGGAVWGNQEDVSLESSVLIFNWAMGQGGAVYNSSGGAVEIYNCTLTMNAAYDKGGGVADLDGDMIIKNTIMWDDYAPNTVSGQDELYYTSAPTVQYTDLEMPGTTAFGGGGDYNMTVDPEFNNVPQHWERTTTTTYIPSHARVANGTGDYSNNHHVIFNNDGIGRTVTARSANLIEFNPPLQTLSYTSYLVENWGSGTNYSESIALTDSTPAALIDSGTSVSLLESLDYLGKYRQAGDGFDIGAAEYVSEYQCSDGVDNDSWEGIDMDDADCSSVTDTTED